MFSGLDCRLLGRVNDWVEGRELYDAAYFNFTLSLSLVPFPGMLPHLAVGRFAAAQREETGLEADEEYGCPAGAGQCSISP